MALHRTEEGIYRALGGSQNISLTFVSGLIYRDRK